MVVREPILLNREEAHKIAGKLNLQLPTQNDKEPEKKEKERESPCY